LKNIENFDENQLTFRFSRKNRPISKTAFCQNNEKFREKNHPNYRSFDERQKIYWKKAQSI